MNSRSPMKAGAALDALDHLQASLREREVNLAEWEQAVRDDRKGRSNG